MSINPLKRDVFDVAFTRELQRTEELLTTIADWQASTGPERGRCRRYALRLLAAERRRRAAAYPHTRRAA